VEDNKRKSAASGATVGNSGSAEGLWVVAPKEGFNVCLEQVGAVCFPAARTARDHMAKAPAREKLCMEENRGNE
jgi:hypothetical protein